MRIDLRPGVAHRGTMKSGGCHRKGLHTRPPMQTVGQAFPKEAAAATAAAARAGVMLTKTRVHECALWQPRSPADKN
eukprot:15390532-Alexandrium_andersonii.AAC.1